MRRKILVVLALLAFLTAGPVLADDDAAGKLIKRGDKFYGNRGKGTKWVDRAIECYEKALAVDTKSVAASWRLTRACYWLGGDQKESATRLKTYQKGIDAAKRAIKFDESSVECHYWLGVCYGKYGETKGIMNSIGLIPHIKKEMNRVIELDENYNHGGAWCVLGRLYNKVPGALGGDNKKSLECLEKAKKLDKDHLLARLFLADTLLSLDRKDDAIKALKFVIDAPVQKGREPENAKEKKQAKKKLAELVKDDPKKKPDEKTDEKADEKTEDK
ncbi:MAG: TRAP transporter TatT component family protein [Planctomycetota bacterium]